MSEIKPVAWLVGNDNVGPYALRHTDPKGWKHSEGLMKISDHEAEVARLRAEVEGLAQSLTEAFEADKEQAREISELRTNLEKYQKAVRKIRARADSDGTAKQHGMQYVAGLRNAANMIDAAMGASA
ncbi:hypothetical protein [Stenotrophomonas maltophilia]|uniref:hypothetical protein n=1 Tax=Stenotrophomonas maltophilia TaxID=40324 RepID=UPI0039C075EB